MPFKSCLGKNGWKRENSLDSELNIRKKMKGTFLKAKDCGIPSGCLGHPHPLPGCSQWVMSEGMNENECEHFTT